MDVSKVRLVDRRRRTRALRALAALLSSSWPIAAIKQTVAPTPQPPDGPVTPEQAGEIEIENWAVHGQSTFTWMLHLRVETKWNLALHCPRVCGRT